MSKCISNEKKEENRQLYRSIYEEYNKGKYIKILSKYVREFVEFKLQQYVKS